jgi:hypothetical protein
VDFPNGHVKALVGRKVTLRSEWPIRSLTIGDGEVPKSAAADCRLDICADVVGVVLPVEGFNESAIASSHSAMNSVTVLRDGVTWRRPRSWRR